MKEVLEKIIERLEEKRFNCDLECASWKNKSATLFRCADAQRIAYINAIETVNQVAEEYAADINVGNNDSTKINQEPKTRIECLSSMSVGELADRILVSSAIVEIDFCQNISECDDITTHGGAIPDEMCKKCLIQWLNSPE